MVHIPDLDQQQLRALSTLHYVLAGLTFLIGCFPLIYVAMGIFFLVSPPPQSAAGPTFTTMGWSFIIMGSIPALLLWFIGGLAIAGGRCLVRNSRHTFCLVAAGVSCFFIPVGTVLGIFTIIVLMRSSVKERFAAKAQQALA